MLEDIPKSIDPQYDKSPECPSPGFLFSSSLFIGFPMICSQMHTCTSIANDEIEKDEDDSAKREEQRLKRKSKQGNSYPH